MENSINNNNNLDTLIVISRFNENLEWLKDEPFHKYDKLIYNKGLNNDFYHSEKEKGIISIENIGRCDHTYLYHIINNYDNLNDITIFLPGSVDMYVKMQRCIRLLNLIEENKSAVFFLTNYENVKNEYYSFQLDSWDSSHEKNAILTKNDTLKPANIRPFGKWFEDKFGDLIIHHISWWGIFSISKKDILQHPKSYYENLITELNTHSNPEAGHYFERSWEAVFYPLKDTKILY